MPRTLAPFVGLLALALPAAAMEWTLKPGDRPYAAAELAARLDGHTVSFYDGGRSEYGPGDAYAYVYSDDDRVPGTYRITDAGEVCVEFAHGARRCDVYVRNNGRDILIDEKGDRYPVR